jgi:transposase InsO family protein
LENHDSQFREQWEKWCRRNGIEPLFAHPSYPQDKGKVKRCIQSLNRELSTTSESSLEGSKVDCGDTGNSLTTQGSTAV